MSFTPDEVRFLIAHSDQIAAASAELPSMRRGSIADVEKLRTAFGARGRAVAELLQARSSGKLPPDWLVCRESAQQATPPEVADYRARKLVDALGTGHTAADVTCSVGTEGAALGAVGFDYVGADLDFSRLLMARHNLGGGSLIRADALTPCVRADVVIADPARRAGGRRITDPAQLHPPLPELISAWRGTPMAVKCAPGLDFSTWEGLVSVVSLDGGVKEACLYTEDLFPGRREAVVIRSGSVDVITDSLDDSVGAGAPGTFIIDPDGAIVRAGVLRHYAAREELWMLDERIAYLTGDRIPAGESGFRFIEEVPIKRLRAALAAHGAGSVEILVRGVDVDPDRLRKKLALKGGRAMAVVITRIGSRGVALICGPRQWNGV
ncbi:THUMP-like domain-containing protein [Corynebacterium pacaense]|uniref:THUMP-like domain-containing protein n=1 Tax=Corynebacterium pacaense TaxID=1816684 RepID=UPI0009B99B8B|nr:SAM-dependent methyltransferase [Corynebacterium pacaense]